MAAAAIGIAGSVISAKMGAGAAEDAAEAQQESSAAAIDEQRRQFEISQELIRPSIEAGDVSRESLLATLGLGTPEAQLQSFEQFRETPGFRFAQEEGEGALLRGASAIGGLGGGRVRQELQRQGIGFGEQQFGSFQNRLAALAGAGQTSATNLAQFGQTSASNIGNLMQAGGAAQASGILGAQQANAGALGQIAQLGGSLFDTGGIGAPGGLGGGLVRGVNFGGANAGFGSGLVNL